MASKEVAEAEAVTTRKGDDESAPLQLPECGHTRVINPNEAEIL